jgi:heme exporter protein C
VQAKPRWLTVLDFLSALMLLAATVLVLAFTPIEAVMGPVQKVFYFHVSTAWVGMLGFGVAAVVGIFYLRTSDRKWDLAAVAAVEIGLVFTLICIVLGSIWARPIWNAWWTWDPRLTTATIMELIYAAYLMLRQGLDEPEKRARFGAVYAIIGVVSVPLTFISIRIFRTIHPVIVGGSDPNATGSFDMSPAMLRAFMFSLATFSVIFIDLLWHRIRLAKLTDKIEQLKLRLTE